METTDPGSRDRALFLAREIGEARIQENPNDILMRRLVEKIVIPMTEKR
jgi:hypothetical protein